MKPTYNNYMLLFFTLAVIGMATICFACHWMMGVGFLSAICLAMSACAQELKGKDKE